MAQQAGPPEGGSPTERLVALAVQLRAAATQAGRLDVAEKVDEVIALLGPSEAPTGGRGRRDAGNAILRTLDGLGF